MNLRPPRPSVFLRALNFCTKLHQKSDSYSIPGPLFFNKFSVHKGIKKDVPDYQAHPHLMTTSSLFVFLLGFIFFRQ